MLMANKPWPTTMSPSTYNYKETEAGHELYLGEFSTVEGLVLFDMDAQAEVVEFGATSFRSFGWATENELPELCQVKDIVTLLTTDEDLGLVDFSARIKNGDVLSTHDDGECHFILGTRSRVIEMLLQVCPGGIAQQMIGTLLKFQGQT